MPVHAGPTSSKVGIGIGLAKAGLPGAIAAWLAFTLPSALALLLFAYGVEAVAADLNAGWLHGLKVVAVVAQAVWGMAKNLCPDAPRFTPAVVAGVIAIIWPTSLGQAGAIAAGAIAGCTFPRATLVHRAIAREIQNAAAQPVTETLARCG